MKHPRETEIKLKVEDSRGLKRQLEKLGFRTAKARHFESNVLFDFEDFRLRSAGCLLRLRVANREAVLTFKTAPQVSQRYKIRGEIETEVQKPNRLRQVLEKLGLRQCFRYDKYRTVFAQRGKRSKAETPLVVYDETPIGNYLELEGPARWIDSVARKLGYHRRDYITASYGTLYRRRCIEQGREPRDMVFPRRKT